MEIYRRQDHDIDEITITGEVDASSSIELDTTIAQSIADGYKKIIVDCHALTYISSAGLGVFMSYIEECRKNHITMVLVHLNERVESSFEVLGLVDLLHIRKSKTEAKKLIHALSV